LQKTFITCLNFDWAEKEAELMIVSALYLTYYIAIFYNYLILIVSD